MKKESVNVNRGEADVNNEMVDTKKSVGNEEKRNCQQCQQLSHENARINNNAHITRNAQEKSRECNARVDVAIVDKGESERSIEQYLIRRCVALGCLTFKFVSPNNSGVPDRIVIEPGGDVHFVEVKRIGGRVSPLQQMCIGKLRGHGCDARVLWSRADVDAFVDELTAGIVISMIANSLGEDGQ